MNDEPKDASNDNKTRANKPQAHLTKKEIYALKQSKYNENIDKFENSYVILNKKTGMIVEMKAMSPVHACTMIGWRIRSCRLIDTIKKEKKDPVDFVDIVEIVEKK
jgi:hypothetical protein